MLHHLDFRSLAVGSNIADLVLVDPPFGVAYQNPYTHEKHEVLEGDEKPFDYGALAAVAYRLLKMDRAFYAFTGWSTYPYHFPQVEAAGFKMKEPLVCQKRASGTTDLEGSLQTNADWLLFGQKGRFKFRPTQLLRNKRAGTIPNKGRKPVPVWKRRFPSHWFGEEFPWSTENSQFQKKLLGLGAPCKHPTIKGLEFCKWVIQLTTDPGDLVVDLCAGSGTTLLAAKQLGRRYLGCEIDERFVALAQWRLENDA
jgi:site-specific DNA-methyltransferase (adenine-specific)